ncbi:MAG: carboxylating nicotinate-nucleotide diphosphorylase [Pseudomonadota bacterium]|nr:carboxylating nicotinate-nucleotide diphosphorylase [Pseudomonadota bacterium]
MELDKLIDSALNEDLPQGDLTTESLCVAVKIGKARLIAKEDLVLSGTNVFTQTIRKLASDCLVKWYFRDGEIILNGQTAALIEGNLVGVIKAERVAINFLGHLSGIATYTRCFADRLKNTKTKILDTRKTTPLLRVLEKQAVVHGGGVNHRANLSEAILIKENHIHLAGGIREAITKIRTRSSKPIEIEAKNLDDVKLAVELKVTRIMFDNMDNETIRKAMQIVPQIIETEASGNMTLDRITTIAELGVNFISVGAITHSAPTADFSLIFDGKT